eukprot:gene8945-9613_t
MCDRAADGSSDAVALFSTAHKHWRPRPSVWVAGNGPGLMSRNRILPLADRWAEVDAVRGGERRRWHFVLLLLPREWCPDLFRRVDLVARGAGIDVSRSEHLRAQKGAGGDDGSDLFHTYRAAMRHSRVRGALLGVMRGVADGRRFVRVPSMESAVTADTVYYRFLMRDCTTVHWPVVRGVASASATGDAMAIGEGAAQRALSFATHVMCTAAELARAKEAAALALEAAPDLLDGADGGGRRTTVLPPSPRTVRKGRGAGPAPCRDGGAALGSQCSSSREQDEELAQRRQRRRSAS